VAKEPLQLPFSIQAGQEVAVPGILRALIRNEWSEKPVGKQLESEDAVRIVAVFGERLVRPIPDFCPQRTIQIKYPIRLDAPKYMDCVAKGGKVSFSWVVSLILPSIAAESIN